MNQAVTDTLLSRVYDVAIISPLQYAPQLSQRFGAQVYLKREDLQTVHSFKLRGAYNKISQLTNADKKHGVIAVSAGNHAQGVALAAKTLGIDALIIMPKTTPSIKVDAVASYGATIELYGDNVSEAFEYCAQRQQATKRTFIHPFDDPLVIAGQGTIGKEIIEQLPQVTHIFVPVGGGGLISGIAQYVKALRPDIAIIGVEPEDSNVMQQSLAAKKRITLPHVGIFADGVAVKQLGEHTFRIARQYVDQCVTVSNDQICAAVKAIFEETRGVVEPAGALAVAGIMANAKKPMVAVAINSGANVQFERLQYIAERTLIGSQQEALFIIALHEEAGALALFCNRVIKGHNITQFAYRFKNRGGAHILVGVGVQSQKDKHNFINNLQKNSYQYKDVTNDEIAKEHVRFMVGGAADDAQNEHFYRVSFPERPGALHDFLQKIHGPWNISAFHYRGQGGDTGLVLIGFECSEPRKLEKSLTSTGYDWQPISQNTALQTFL